MILERNSEFFMSFSEKLRFHKKNSSFQKNSGPGPGLGPGLGWAWAGAWAPGPRACAWAAWVPGPGLGLGLCLHGPGPGLSLGLHGPGPAWAWAWAWPWLWIPFKQARLVFQSRSGSRSTKLNGFRSLPTTLFACGSSHAIVQKVALCNLK